MPSDNDTRDLPWLEPLRERLRQALLRDRLPHGLLLEGPQGIGKRCFSRWLTALVMCAAPRDRRPCRECRNCQWLAAGTHPDVYDVLPEQGKKWISVEQTRSLIESLSLKSFAGGPKVAIVVPASSLTPNAADSLLKTLEEPTPGTLLMLVASRPARLPATVRSRCQRLRFSAPAPAESLGWLRTCEPRADWPRLLELAGGAPLAAIELHESGIDSLDSDFCSDLEGLIRHRQQPFVVANRWGRSPPELVLRWLEHCTRQLIVSRFRDAGPQSGLQKAAENLKLERLFHYLDRVDELRRLLDSPLNWPLQIESLVIPWSEGLRLTADDRAIE